MKFAKPTIDFGKVIRGTESKWADIFVNGYRAGGIKYGHGMEGWAFFICAYDILPETGFTSDEVRDAIPEQCQDGGYPTRAAAKKAFIKDYLHPA